VHFAAFLKFPSRMCGNSARAEGDNPLTKNRGLELEVSHTIFIDWMKKDQRESTGSIVANYVVRPGRINRIGCCVISLVAIQMRRYD
jgi:hypothetical protein